MKNLKIFTNNIEQEAVDQINKLLDQDAFKDSKVRIMPDVHSGSGCVIGFTADLGKKVIPNIVGVDIGCGVRVVKFLDKKEIDLKDLDNFIKNNIPSGFNIHNPGDEVENCIDLKDLYCYEKLRNKESLPLAIGTLGGGNHFIELDKDDDGFIYLVVHTGSRNLGCQVAKIYQEIAIKHCFKVDKDSIHNLIQKLKDEGKEKEIQNELLKLKNSVEQSTFPKELAYLEGKERDEYLHDMRLCQMFAIINRETICNKIVDYLNIKEYESFESVHNYIDDNNMVRKGAICASKNKPVIIPLNMRDGSIIGIGKGNEDWNFSAPHGAGRLMSRSKARETLKLDDFKKSMDGIYTSTVDETTIDEAPMVYKNASEIINLIKDTVEITNLIKPIYNFKASGKEK